MAWRLVDDQDIVVGLVKVLHLIAEVNQVLAVVFVKVRSQRLTETEKLTPRQFDLGAAFDCLNVNHRESAS
ncbi:hypothetical protein D3C77_610390 [compost metagenome]